MRTTKSQLIGRQGSAEPRLRNNVLEDVSLIGNKTLLIETATDSSGYSVTERHS
jgi:hypothetical protein